MLAVIVGVVVILSYILITQTAGLPNLLVVQIDEMHDKYAEFIQQNHALILLAYFFVYTLVMALSLPLAATMDVLGGFVLGISSFPVAIASICLGSVVPFSIGRKLGSAAIAHFDTASVHRIREGFARNGFQYLILMHLFPWAPFSVKTILSGALGMSQLQFIVATGIGFLPAGLTLNLIGRALRGMSEMNEVRIMSIYRDPDFLMAVAGVLIVVFLSSISKFRRTKARQDR